MDKIASKIFALSARFSISGSDLIKSAIQLTTVGLACAHPAHSSNESVVYVNNEEFNPICSCRHSTINISCHESMISTTDWTT